jgi:hypothetical protein
MKASRAQYTMRHPRKCRLIGFASVDDKKLWESWYYVEGRGLDIMVCKQGAGTVAIKITVRQMQQALRLIASAANRRVKP